MKTSTMAISGDAGLNPELASEVGSLRGGMVAAAERFAMPERFSATPHPDRPAMIVVDGQTGRSTTISLYAYGSFRQGLTELLG